MEKVQEPTHFVYGLVDPVTKLVFYVGQSTRGMKRPKSHREKGWKFAIAILEVTDDPRRIVESVCHWLGIKNPTALSEAERYWIAYGRACGWPLRNKTHGGEGVRATDEVRKRMSAAHLGNDHTDEYRAKLSAIIKARKSDPTANLGNSKPRFDAEQVNEILGRREHGEPRDLVAKRFGVSTGTIRGMEVGRYPVDASAFAGDPLSPWKSPLLPETCSRGHELTEMNARTCRACRNAASRRSHAKRVRRQTGHLPARRGSPEWRDRIKQALAARAASGIPLGRPPTR